MCICFVLLCNAMYYYVIQINVRFIDEMKKIFVKHFFNKEFVARLTKMFINNKNTTQLKIGT